MNLFDFGALSPASNATSISLRCHPFTTRRALARQVASRANGSKMSVPCPTCARLRPPDRRISAGDSHRSGLGDFDHGSRPSGRRTSCVAARDGCWADEAGRKAVSRFFPRANPPAPALSCCVRLPCAAARPWSPATTAGPPFCGPQILLSV